MAPVGRAFDEPIWCVYPVPSDGRLVSNAGAASIYKGNAAARSRAAALKTGWISLCTDAGFMLEKTIVHDTNLCHGRLCISDASQRRARASVL